MLTLSRFRFRYFRHTAILGYLTVAFVALPTDAVEFWYDFEGDSGDLVTDKLASDGSQDGSLEGNTSIQSDQVLFGEQSARFDIPDPIGPGPPPYSSFQVPDSTMLGTNFTIAAHVDNRESTLDFTVLFSSFRGTGPVLNDRLRLDYDPTGLAIPGIRAFVNNVVVQTASVPAGLASPGYHHYALTLENGTLRIYFDGLEVASDIIGLGYTNSLDLRIGEDPHDGGGSANEQLIGHVDEVLVINRALSAGQIQNLTVFPVSTVITPVLGEYAVYYDFEGDLTDQFIGDGSQNAIAIENATLGSDPLDAVDGNGSGRLDLPVQNAEPFSRIEVGPVGNLGSSATISATLNYPQAGHAAGGLTRLFSSYGGTGNPLGTLIFDFDPAASVEGIGIRVILPDLTLVQSSATSALDVRHTMTATYDAGEVLLYLDGLEVASGSTTGNLDLGSETLYIGEDTGSIVNENYIGILDDAFIIERALTPAEVQTLHQFGAETVLPEPSLPILLMSGALHLITRRRSLRPTFHAEARNRGAPSRRSEARRPPR